MTLTYAPDSLPHDGSLNVQHFQSFMRRLRQKVRREDKKAKRELRKLRFFHVGEYGEAELRPHYHAILFGWEPGDRVQYKRNDQGDMLYTSAALEKLWRLGFCTFGAVTQQSAMYCARYTQKKITGPRARAAYERTLMNRRTGEITTGQVKPEYATMSRRPGIGYDWFQRYAKTDVYMDDQVIINNKHFRPPRYYDNLLEEADPSFLNAIKEKRRMALDTDNNTAERRSTQEESARLRDLAIKRKL